MTPYEIKTIPATTLTGYPVTLPLPTMDNVAAVSKGKSQHFMQLAQSGQFEQLMAASHDHIGYALSRIRDGQLEYFAGANTSATADQTATRELPAGNYIILKASGGPSRQLFDELIKTFFGEILPQRPELYQADSYIIEALMNNDPRNAVVELRLPTTVTA